jgi:hypothetical protein
MKRNGHAFQGWVLLLQMCITLVTMGCVSKDVSVNRIANKVEDSWQVKVVERTGLAEWNVCFRYVSQKHYTGSENQISVSGEYPAEEGRLEFDCELTSSWRDETHGKLDSTCYQYLRYTVDGEEQAMTNRLHEGVMVRARCDPASEDTISIKGGITQVSNGQIVASWIFNARCVTNTWCSLWTAESSVTEGGSGAGLKR